MGRRHMSQSACRAAAAALAALCGLPSAITANATAIPSARLSVLASTDGNVLALPLFNGDLSRFLHPGASEELDFSTSNGIAFVRAGAFTTGPLAAADGEVGGRVPGFPNSAAEVSYVVQVRQLGPIPGFTGGFLQVPVTLRTNLEANADGGGMAIALLDSPLGTLEQIACGPGTPCTPHASGTNALSGKFQPNFQIFIDIFASGAVAPGTDGDFGAFADPVVTVDDALIPTTNLNFQDFFTIDVSPGVVQSLGHRAVPEPSVLAMVALAGLVMVVRLHAGRPRTGRVRNHRHLTDTGLGFGSSIAA